MPRMGAGRCTALTASCVLNNGKRLQWLGRVTAVDAALDTERTPPQPIAFLEPNASTFRMAGGLINTGPSGGHQRVGSRSAWIPRLCRPGWKLHSGKNAEGCGERKVRVVALKDGKALVTVPELRDGDALAL